MAFVLNYNSLTTAVTNYLERNDANLIAQIPLFIMLGERRIARDMKILGLKVSITDKFIPPPGPTVGVFQKPTRWLNDSSFRIGIGTGFNQSKYLLQRSIEWCRLYWPDATKYGTPKYYASDWNYNFWAVFPPPDIAYNYEIIYYETPTLIDTTTSINFLTGSAPEIFLFATLAETAPYLRDDERIKVWEQKYSAARQALGDEDIRRIEDAFSKRGG